MTASQRRRQAAVLTALLALAGCKTELYSAVPEQEANEMLALLLMDGMDAAKVTAKDGSISLTVERSQFATAVELLRARGYPHEKFSTINDVFQPSGLIASPVQEQARYLWALGQELSRTVAQIDGVLTARVQVVLPDNDLLNRNPTPSSASVFVRYDDASHVADLVPQIKMLVANSVAGLAYGKVSVVLVAVAHAAAPPPPLQRAPAWQEGGLTAILAAGGAAIVALFIARGRLAALLARIKRPSLTAAE